MRPSLTRIAPSRISEAETGMTRPAAKILASSLSGIPSDHLGGYDLEKLALGAVGQEPEALHGRVNLAFCPRLGLGYGVRSEHGLDACLERLGRRMGLSEYAPDRRRVALAQSEDHGQRHRAFGEVSPYALAHDAGLPYEIHDVVGHLEGDPERLPVGRQRVYLPEREPAQGAACHAGRLEEPRCLLPYVLEVSLDLDRRPARPVLLELPRGESFRSLGECAHQPRVPYLRKPRESLGEEMVPRCDR